MRIWHLLTHTAGLTYGFHHAHPVDAMYRAAGFEWGTPAGRRPRRRAATPGPALPLLFQPGTEWNYSVATDVLGRVVEVRLGPAARRVLRRADLRPARHDRHRVPRRARRDHDRLAALYAPGPADRARDAASTPWATPRSSRPTALSGGGGLVSTAHDYHRFTQMLLGGGELDGVRLLGPRTVATWPATTCPGGADLEAFGRPLFAETTFDGRRLRPRLLRGRTTRSPSKVAVVARASSAGAARRARRSGSTRSRGSPCCSSPSCCRRARTRSARSCSSSSTRRSSTETTGIAPAFYATPDAWRAWLEAHHADEREHWVGFHKRGTGRQSITWPEAVDQALCFGWIDGVRKRVDDDALHDPLHAAQAREPVEHG